MTKEELKGLIDELYGEFNYYDDEASSYAECYDYEASCLAQGRAYAYEHVIKLLEEKLEREW